MVIIQDIKLNTGGFLENSEALPICIYVSMRVVHISITCSLPLVLVILFFQILLLDSFASLTCLFALYYFVWWTPAELYAIFE